MLSKRSSDGSPPTDSSSDWADITKMRHTNRPSTSCTTDVVHTGGRGSFSKKKKKKKANRLCEEEPQLEESVDRVFLPVSVHKPSLTARLNSNDTTSRLTALLASAEDKLREQLLIASEKGRKHAVYLLLHQHGIDRDRCRGLQGYTPVHHAATRGHLDVLQLLLSFGWSVNSGNDSMETPLHLACYAGHSAIVEFLLDHGADVNARTAEDETPLFYAARKNHYRIVRLLIRRECDLSVRNRYGDVAQDEATSDKTMLEFAVGKEDVERLYRRATMKGKSLAFRGEVMLMQKHREAVLSFLDLKSLCRASQVNYRWHRAADTPALWRKLGVSRWELQLQTTVGIGAVAPMSMLTVGGGLQLNVASLTGARRPSSCSHDAASAVAGRYSTPTKNRSNSSIFIDQRRPQTARSLLD